ncbi:MAG TPA: phospholipase [Candidatus Paraprevotella stercorigallinarum]|jgi:succinate dehydrogenase flavin-adding protein (antitoxin of CptAB toxin-antitoxin module)|nr:phospholipase [Candidatus Paraprevotella stercorigallinarum]
MIVVYCIVALLAIAGIAIIADLINRRNLKKKIEKGEIDEMPQVVQVDQECCGQHEICEKESLLAAVSKNIEYYNDEELDRFRGKDSSEYSEAETDEFREILYTMKDEEVAGWVRSLQLRNVPLPDAIKDEVFLIVGERRFDH